MDVGFLGLIMGLTFTFNHGWNVLILCNLFLGFFFFKYLVFQ